MQERQPHEGVTPVRAVPRRRWVGLVALIGLGAVSAACAGEDVAELPAPRETYDDGTVTGNLVADGRFGALVALLERAEVSQGRPGARQVIGTAAEVAEMPGWDHTIFAPIDDAFSRLDRDTLDCMFEEANATEGVRVHVVPRVLTSDEFAAGEIQTIAGPASLELEGEEASFAGVRIVETDLAASNGVIHVIDAVVVPDVCA